MTVLELGQLLTWQKHANSMLGYLSFSHMVTPPPELQKWPENEAKETDYFSQPSVLQIDKELVVLEAYE